jgi:hypothetical protein
VTDTDSDGDGTADCNDSCPADPGKTDPGICGCSVADTDSDGDGTPDCIDACPSDLTKTEPGICGCGVSDEDLDGDGIPDCFDTCPDDPDKTEPGICGCGVADVDSDSDELLDCNDSCPSEDATGFDADQDGCIDTVGGLTDVVGVLEDEGVLDETVASPLISKVESAVKSADKDNICAAINQLEAFKKQVNAQRGKKISDEAADDLIAYADSVIAALLADLPTGESC